MSSQSFTEQSIMTRDARLHPTCFNSPEHDQLATAQNPLCKPLARLGRRCWPLPAIAFHRIYLAPFLITACAAFILPFNANGLETSRAALVQSHCVTEDKVPILSPGETISQKMKGGEVHTFQLFLSLKQYAQVVFEQQGIDVAVRVRGPDCGMIVELDSPNGLLGPESVSVIAQLQGLYTIEIIADKTMPAGAYQLRVEGPRAQTPSDVERVEAEHIFMDAQKLRLQGGADSRTQAIEKYKMALEIWSKLGDERWEGYTLCSIGRVYKAMGMLMESIDYFKQARERLEHAQDVAGQAFILNEAGAANRDLGDPSVALDYYGQALELRRSIGDLWGQAQLFNNIGHVYSNTGRLRKAIEHFEKALPLWQALDVRYMEANTLNNIAEAYSDLGDLAYALENFQRLLRFCLETGDRPLEAYVRNNIGKIYVTRSESQAALDAFMKALDIFRQLKNAGGEALVLENTGMLYGELDDGQRALRYFQDALKIRQQLNEPRGMAIVLNNIGYAQTILGNYQEALKHLERALPLSRASQNRPFEAYALVNIGIVYVSLGELQKALEHYQRALEIQNELKDLRGQGITLDKIGQVYGLTGQSSKALDSYRQALQRWNSIDDRQGAALSLYGIARAQRDLHNLREARDRIEEAIKIVESLRTKLTGPQLRMTYFAAKQDYYTLDIDVKMRLYQSTQSTIDMEAALATSERGRARNLLDLLTEARAEIGGSAPELAGKSRQLEQEISALAQSLLRLRNLNRAEDAAAVEDRLSTLITEFDELQAKIRTGSIPYAELSRPQPLVPRQIQQLLDDDTLFLEYALGEGRSYLWAISRTEINSYVLPDRTEIENAARTLRETFTAYEPPRSNESNTQYLARLRQATADYRQQARKLSSMVLGPVSSRLGKKRLVIVADGALLYIPFEALPQPAAVTDSGQPMSDSREFSPLILKNEVVYQPSASTFARLRAMVRRKPPKTVAVLADPVFDNKDERLPVAVRGQAKVQALRSQLGELSRALRDVGATGTDFSLTRLRFSAEEANAITNIAPPGSWMKSTGFQASRAMALSPELRQYNIVHFATHSILNEKHPELSGIVLSMVNQRGQPEDGFLRMGDIYNLNLPIELVVLSACRTGVGKQVRGEGLIGLTRGFMYAGVPRVVASLWKVDDEATAELMKRFYLNMLNKKMAAAAALRQARIELMEAREQWSEPYYWAGFMLQGDWK